MSDRCINSYSWFVIHVSDETMHLMLPKYKNCLKMFPIKRVCIAET